MKKILRPFQQVGAAFLASHPHALLADEPGLGKTLQAIAAAEKIGARKILVVCPASVRLGWVQELRECGVDRSGWKVASYNEAVRWENGYNFATWDLLILDEVHFLKTADSQRTRAIFGPGGLARQCGYKWGLSGTPVLNRPVELWPIVKSLAPNFADMSFNKYAQQFCGAYFDGHGINVKGASRLKELSGLLDGFMLRREKMTVMPELPARIVTRVPLEVSLSELHEVLRVEKEQLSREAKLSPSAETFSALGDVSTLLRVTGEAKVRAAVSFIEDLLETQEKVVVFTTHRRTLTLIEAGLSHAKIHSVTYQGGQSDLSKQAAVQCFVESRDCRVFLGNIKAAGTGINGLQGVASSCVFAELSWTPGEMSQALDRLHRIGQKASEVNAYVLHVPGTLESAVLGVNDNKQSVIDRLLGDPIADLL